MTQPARPKLQRSGLCSKTTGKIVYANACARLNERIKRSLASETAGNETIPLTLVYTAVKPKPGNIQVIHDSVAVELQPAHKPRHRLRPPSFG